MIRAWVVAGLVFVGALSAQRPPPGTIVVGELGQRLQAAVTKAAPDYWGAVLVASQGKPVFVRGYGPADRKPPKRGKKSRGMDSKSLFDLEGASQHLAALLALRLQRDRKLRLSDPVGKYLDDWPADKKAMTIDHLLQHTSGMPTTAKWPRGAGKTARTALDVLKTTPLKAPPGQGFHFSTLNGSLLAVVLEECGGQRFDKLLEERVLKPFGMSGAGHANERFSDKLVTVRRVKGKDEPATAILYNWRCRGVRGVLASVHDVHSLLDRLYLGKLLDRRERDLLWRPVAGTAYRVATASIAGHELRAVSGAGGGYRTNWIMHDPTRTWIVLCTANGTKTTDLEAALVGELADTWAAAATEQPADPQPAATEPEPEPSRPAPSKATPAASAAQAARFVGTFSLPSGGCFRIQRHGAGLRIYGEGAEAAVRIVEGQWPGTRGALVQRSEDRGLALLGRLLRGDATAIDDAFADVVTAEKVSNELAGVLAEHGALVRTEFLGTDFPSRGKVESWFRIVCAKKSATVRIGWQGDRQFRSCVQTTAEPPFWLDLAPLAPDWAASKTADGKVVRLTMEGRDGQRVLVFEDATVGDAGLVDCEESSQRAR